MRDAFLLAHDLFRKPVSPFRDHAPAIQQKRPVLASRCATVVSLLHRRCRGTSFRAQSRGVSGTCDRTERQIKANPTNLIRVMPAEGEEMQTSPQASFGALPQIAADVLECVRALAERGWQ
jgi:hypothetical protein